MLAVLKRKCGSASVDKWLDGRECEAIVMWAHDRIRFREGIFIGIYV